MADGGGRGDRGRRRRRHRSERLREERPRERDSTRTADAVKQTGVHDMRNGGNPAQCRSGQRATKKLDDADQA